jgi:Cdc6-like AAA superfamily ATPase
MTMELMGIERLSKAFTPTRPIDQPKFFRGRVELLYRAVDAVNTPGLHAALFGDRGVGKTSIAHVLAYLAQEPNEKTGTRSILISCNSGDDYPSIWRKVLLEIQIAQRQLGFVQHDTAIIVGNIDVDGPIADPNDVRLFVRSLPNPSVIVIDEFDRVPRDGETHTLMADTIKLFSDSNVESTIVLVGVADSLGDLIGTHPSIARNLAQIPVEPMTTQELEQIVSRGFTEAGMSMEGPVDARIAKLSQGYPYYTRGDARM